MVQLDKCHHISTTSTSKDGPQSFRVRICKTCCQEDSHIELGTYVDQESAILVNDTFEILNERLDRLIVWRVEDKPDLHHLVEKKLTALAQEAAKKNIPPPPQIDHSGWSVMNSAWQIVTNLCETAASTHHRVHKRTMCVMLVSSVSVTKGGTLQ